MLQREYMSQGLALGNLSTCLQRPEAGGREWEMPPKCLCLNLRWEALERDFPTPLILEDPFS